MISKAYQDPAIKARLGKSAKEQRETAAEIERSLAASYVAVRRESLDATKSLLDRARDELAYEEGRGNAIGANRVARRIVALEAEREIQSVEFDNARKLAAKVK